IGVSSQLNSLVRPKIDKLPVDTYRRPEPSILAAMNTFGAKRIIDSQRSVLAILFWCGLPQIHNAIVILHKIDVIQLSLQQLAIHIEPRQTVCVVSATIDFNLDV